MKLRRYTIAALLCLLLVAVFTGLGLTEVSAETATITLAANEIDRTVTVDTVLDLSGYHITTLTVNKGVTVYLKDSQTDDYLATNGRTYGKITTIKGSGSVEAADGYLLVKDAVTSAHKVELTVSGVSLRAADLETEGASLYYQCTFGGDEVVKEHVVAYGTAMGAGRIPDYGKNTYTRIQNTENWVIGEKFTGNSILLTGIMRTGKTNSDNLRDGETDIYCQAYIDLKNGVRVAGDCVQFSLRELLEGTKTLKGIDSRWGELESTEKTAALNLYNTFNSVVDSWGVPQIRQSVTGGSYLIKIPADMKILSEKPNGTIELATDIDMKGVDFTPVPSFSGTFDGNNYSIYNLKVDSTTAGYADYIGMFLWLTESAVVRDLDLEYITVDASATRARFIGTLAGRNNGQILDCTVTGTIIDDQPGAETRLIFVGAIAGRAGDNSITRGEPILSVKNTVTNVNGKTVTYSTTGLCAKVKLNVPDSPYVMKRLVGNVSAINVTYSGDWQDLSFNTEDDSAVVQARRKAAVKAMHEMGTVKWTVPNLQSSSSTPDLIHYGTTDEATKEKHIHTQKFFSGTTYYGIPYDHTSSSYEQFMHYMDEGTNGVYVLNNEAAAAGNSTWQVREADGFGNQVYKGFTKYIGNDCSGAVAWAWHHAAPRYVGGGGVYVLLSNNTIPTDAAQTNHGIYRVGGYSVTDDMTEVVDEVKVVTTPKIATTNGSNTMYEAYARAQMGDGLIYGAPAGHVRLLAQDSVVIRNKDGAIYSTKSYVITHEQGDGLYDRTTTNSSWRINYQYTFYQLYYGKSKSSGKGYLPITIKAFQDESVPVLSTYPYEYTSGGVERMNTPAAGQINAGNRILSATVVVKDSYGNVVYEKTAYKGSNGLYNAYRSVYLTMIMKYYFSDYVNNLRKGQAYSFSVDCTVAGGTLNEDGTIRNTTVNLVKDRFFIHS